MRLKGLLKPNALQGARSVLRGLGISNNPWLPDYHVKLHCYVVIELKARDFQPEDAGQMSFYLSAVDGILKQKEDNPTIGLLLCKGKNKVVAEYALKGINQPLGVSEYQLVEALPKNLEDNLPTIEKIEHELGKMSQEEGV